MHMMSIIIRDEIRDELKDALKLFPQVRPVV